MESTLVTVFVYYSYAGLSSLGVPGVPWHTQILADQLTLFQPGGTDYAHLITTGTPGFSDLPTALSYLIEGAHWFFLEIFVRKFKRGNQRVLVQNWVKNVGINKCSLSKNLKNGPKLQL